jgi:RNA:NAD 2'-phosphotransferase (TPT1/KptA family)
MLSEKESTNLSKFLNSILRHQPRAIVINLDEQRSTNVRGLIEKTPKSGRNITTYTLKYVVELTTCHLDK